MAPLIRAAASSVMCRSVDACLRLANRHRGCVRAAISIAIRVSTVVDRRSCRAGCIGKPSGSIAEIPRTASPSCNRWCRSRPGWSRPRPFVAALAAGATVGSIVVVDILARPAHRGRQMLVAPWCSGSKVFAQPGCATVCPDALTGIRLCGCCQRATPAQWRNRCRRRRAHLVACCVVRHEVLLPRGRRAHFPTIGPSDEDEVGVYGIGGSAQQRQQRQRVAQSNMLQFHGDLQ